uniref:Uncharacterized protein n=1 Tax=Vitis vinifera TaxID=29760 RepID=F6I7C6_VITVI
MFISSASTINFSISLNWRQHASCIYNTCLD